MARIGSIDSILDLIPAPNNKFYMSVITRAKTEAILKNPIYAYVINPETYEIEEYYRAEFILFSSENSVSDTNHYLFIGKYGQDMTSSMPYITVKIPKGCVLNKKDWDFKHDELGLYVISGTRHHHKIYFTSSSSDINIIREALKSKANKDLKKVKITTLVTSPVYI